MYLIERQSQPWRRRRGSSDVEARSSGGDEGDGAFRCSQRTLLIGLGLGRRWGTGGCGEPHVSSPSPHLLFIALRDRGPSASRKAERPRSGRGSRAQLGQLVEINLTFSPLISPYDLNLTSFFLFPILS